LANWVLFPVSPFFPPPLLFFFRVAPLRFNLERTISNSFSSGFDIIEDLLVFFGLAKVSSPRFSVPGLQGLFLRWHPRSLFMPRFNFASYTPFRWTLFRFCMSPLSSLVFWKRIPFLGIGPSSPHLVNFPLRLLVLIPLKLFLLVQTLSPLLFPPPISFSYWNKAAPPPGRPGDRLFSHSPGGT